MDAGDLSEARKAHPGSRDPLFVLIWEQSQEIQKLADQVDEQNELLNAHMRGEEQMLSRFMNAFPDDDPGGHRTYHEAVMKILEQRAKLRASIIEKTLQGVVWVGIIWIAKSLWEAFKNGVK